MVKNKASKIVSFAAGIISALTPLTANTADTIYSGNFVGNGYNHSQTYTAPQHYTPEQAVVVERKEGKIFPWVTKTWTEKEMILTHKKVQVELRGPCGPVYAEGCIPEYEERCVTRQDFDWLWGRNLKNLCEKLKPKVSYKYEIKGADTCRPHECQPQTCTPATPTPAPQPQPRLAPTSACIPCTPEPQPCKHHQGPSTCRPSPLEEAVRNLFGCN